MNKHVSKEFFMDSKGINPCWIWYPEQRSLPCTFVFFRREIEIDGKCDKAIGTIAADSRYQLFVNGKRIQRGPAPFDPRHQELDPVDLTEHLVEGKNCIGIMVFSFGHAGDGTYIPGMPGLRFELDIFARENNQRIVSDKSWKSLWATCWPAGRHRRNFLRAFQEEFDARKYPYGWNEIGFDDSAWMVSDELDVPHDLPLVSRPHINNLSGIKEPCANLESSSIGLRERSIPFLTEEKAHCMELLGQGTFNWKVPPEEYYEIYTKNAITEHILFAEVETAIFPYEIPAGAIAPGTSNVFLFSLYEEMVGFPYIEIEAEAGTIVEISFGEKRKRDSLLIEEVGNGSWKGQYVRLICRNGLNKFEAFDWEAVKFVSVAIRNTMGSVYIRQVGINRITYPFTHKAEFYCSNDIINKVYDGAVNSCRNTSLETIMDNVIRERQNYQGEVALGYLTHYLVHGEYRLTRRCLKIFGDGQHPDGWFFDTYPGVDRLERAWQNALGLFRWGSILDHGIYYLFHLYWYVFYSGDKSLLFELKDKIVIYCNWLDSVCRQHGGLLPVMPGDSSPEKLYELKKTGPMVWCNGPLSIWMDTAGFQMQRHKKATLNVFYYGMLNMAVRNIAEWLNTPELARVCVSRAENVRKLLCCHFQDDEGLFVDNLPWLPEENDGKRYHDRTLSMALLFGLIEKSTAKKKALRLLRDCPDEMGFSFPPNAWWRLRALYGFGEREALIEDILNRWGKMTSLEICNSFSEGWALNGDFASGAQCQNTSAGPHYAIISGILGITPVAPAFAEYKIAPLLDELDFYSGTIYVPGGSVKVIFRKSAEMMLELELPAEKKAVINLSRRILRAWRDDIDCSNEFSGMSEIVITPKTRTKIKLIFDLEQK